MATLTGMLTGQGTGSVSSRGTARRRAPVPAVMDIGIPLDLPTNLTSAQRHRRVVNAYGKVPQYKGRTAPKLTQEQLGVVAEMYSRFADPLAAWRRRQYRQHALHIPNIANASAGDISRARRDHALGYSNIAPGPPPPTQTVSGTGTGQGTGSTSLSAAMRNPPGVAPGPTPGKPVLPGGVSATELGYLSKALTRSQRRIVGLL